jgi:hypothetical protein
MWCCVVVLDKGIKAAERSIDRVKVLPHTLPPLQRMSSLTQARFSFLYRQEMLITFGISNAFYGVYIGSLLHMEIICPSTGVYATLVAFLMYFFCESLV